MIPKIIDHLAIDILIKFIKPALLDMIDAESVCTQNLVWCLRCKKRLYTKSDPGTTLPMKASIAI